MKQTLPIEVPAGIPSELLQRRPDILQAEQALTAATARIGATKAARFPKLSVTGFLGVASPALSNLLLSGSEFMSGRFRSGWTNIKRTKPWFRTTRRRSKNTASFGAI